MASSIMHMAVTKLAAEKFEIKDLDRLLTGSVLPDFYSDKCVNSHLKLQIRGGTRITYDLTRLKETYGNRMAEDDLYLGYYLHLVQDLVYRDFVYKKQCWNPHIPGNVERLHNDYRLLNPYIIEKYGLQNKLVHPALEADFNVTAEGGTFFFTEEMADDYIRIACAICEKELEAFFAGKKYIDEYEWAWEAKPQSFLETTSNTRELGGYRTNSGIFIRCNRLIRSDAVLKPSERDIAVLSDRNINTVIDLRTEKEILEEPSPFADMPRFFYHGVPIEEGSGIPESEDKVPVSYMEIAGAANMGEAFRHIAHAPDGVLFHCAAGKDRTGVLCAILLMLAEVSDDDIVEEYVLSKEYNKKRLEAASRKYSDTVINIITPNERYMLEFLRLFRERYGGTEKYFEAIGVLSEDVCLLKDKLFG